MRFEFLLGISILLLILAGWRIRFPSLRELLIHVLFTLAVVSFLARHFIASRTT